MLSLQREKGREGKRELKRTSERGSMQKSKSTLSPFTKSKVLLQHLATKAPFRCNRNQIIFPSYFMRHFAYEKNCLSILTLNGQNTHRVCVCYMRSVLFSIIRFRFCFTLFCIFRILMTLCTVKTFHTVRVLFCTYAKRIKFPDVTNLRVKNDFCLLSAPKTYLWSTFFGHINRKKTIPNSRLKSNENRQKYNFFRTLFKFRVIRLVFKSKIAFKHFTRCHTLSD